MEQHAAAAVARQAEQLLAAVTYVAAKGRYEYLYAFFASMYFAALRPAEANWLREADCTLPYDGWGAGVVQDGVAEQCSLHRDLGGAHAQEAGSRDGAGGADSAAARRDPA
jgi:hypothetical protein